MFGDWVRRNQTDAEELLAEGGKTARLFDSDLNKALTPFSAWRADLTSPSGVRAHMEPHTLSVSCQLVSNFSHDDCPRCTYVGAALGMFSNSG